MDTGNRDPDGVRDPDGDRDQDGTDPLADPSVAAAVAGDEAAFAQLVQRHQRELQVHCYRMAGSYAESEDLVQETFLRAWRRIDTYAGRSTFRAWLYRIATNACLDALRRSARRVPVAAGHDEILWLQPYPDRLLDQVASDDHAPDAVVVTRETIELALIAALQVLPPRQRVALIARDLLGWSAADTASLLGASVAATNSALQRARATMQARLPSGRLEWRTAEATEAERDLLARFIESHERGDTAAALAMVRDDIRITMPPHPMVYQGIDELQTLLAQAFGEDQPGEWRLVPTRANRQPTAASYLRQWDDTEFRAFKFDVLRIEGGAVAEITTFGAELFPAFGLPTTLGRS